ncbi:MAG TPA: GNAT family N-acetyltransferase [Gammaproteobacteria bacterium]|nr:GNAT family N-acetyltransferase [Gammaproteobacteria bacterium]
MNEFQYRRMQIDDYDEVLCLWAACEGLSIREADSRDGIERYLARNPGLSHVAVLEDRIVGSIMGGHDGKRGYIQHLAVAEIARKQGVASRLVELCVAALKLEGIEKSHVHVLKHNQAGNAYWTRLGWRQRSEIVMYSFINGENKNA